MHITRLVNMLCNAFNGKHCNPQIKNEDRKAVIIEFMNLYFDQQKTEKEYRALQEKNRIAHQIINMVDNELTNHGYSEFTIDESQLHVNPDSDRY